MHSRRLTIFDKAQFFVVARLLWWVTCKNRPDYWIYSNSVWMCVRIQTHTHTDDSDIVEARICDNQFFSVSCYCWIVNILWLMIVIIARCEILASLFTHIFYAVVLFSAHFFSISFYTIKLGWFCLFFLVFSSIYFFLLTNLKNHNDISALFSVFILYVQCLLKGSCVIRSFIQFPRFFLLGFLSMFFFTFNYISILIY